MDADNIDRTKLLRMAGVASRLGVSTRTVKRLIAEHELPVVDIGVGEGANRLRVSEAALAAWIEARTRKGPEA